MTPGIRGHRTQSGYLLEVPLLVAVVVVVVAIAIPRVPPLAADALTIVGALALLAGAWYMLIGPGWNPRRSAAGAGRSAGRWLLFAVIAIIVGVGAIVRIAG